MMTKRKKKNSVTGTVNKAMGWKIRRTAKFQPKQQTVLSPKHYDWFWNQTASNSMDGSRYLFLMSVSLTSL